MVSYGYSSCGVEGRELHGGRDHGTSENCMVSEIGAWSTQPIRSSAVGCPACSTSRGQLPARAPTPELEEGCLRDIPGGGCSRIFTPRAPQNWPPLTACLCPVIRRRGRRCGTPTAQRTVKGKKGSCVSVDLRRCPGETVGYGAAQLDPTRPPLLLCLGFFWPLATTGAIPRTGLFRYSSRRLTEPWSSSSVRSLPSHFPGCGWAHLCRGLLPFLRGCVACFRVFSSLR